MEETPPIPLLLTERLRLRPFTLDDAPTVQVLASAAEIADTTLNLPHPYPEDGAKQWISTHADKARTSNELTWAMCDLTTDQVYGAISLIVRPAYHHAEVGYWMGLPYWGQGYTTEAAHAVLAYGFNQLGLERIFARHLARNPASGRVMQKIGMRFEGCQRRHLVKNGQFEDCVNYGIIRSEYAE
ncbi:GNAT family N-acetyltransferase [Candidatus Chloroploca sp. M-50]|uniref:GNAT family N-acetyltransferase n=1 Tax=Candidatus Chloroploca mongolica TaxID=2528176 RepID=A0ABS4DH32_9CHLR|nr:GNAT family N-acetyltransferase [Candidatus Chloroploca mongolica]MBP1468738.1 GNAT family N-acetyltransferase [Candidatus Chloroploca mongolica]